MVEVANRGAAIQKGGFREGAKHWLDSDAWYPTLRETSNLSYSNDAEVYHPGLDSGSVAE
jgi:hypothetical protein